MKKLEVGLCAGRHEMPVDQYIFGENIESPMNFHGLFMQAVHSLATLCEAIGDVPVAKPGTTYVQASYTTVEVWDRDVELVVYATGMTPALLAVLNAAYAVRFSSITVMHFDRDSGQYMPQRMHSPLDPLRV